jgi:pimeloyl-ACP methyl ester carboxylesterase
MKYGATTPIAKIGLAAPAVRALNGAGYQTLLDVAKVNDADLASLHGFGPKALKQLHQVLADAGLRDPGDTKPKDPGSLLAKSGYVQVGDLRMYYEIGGKGEPLVMLHGGMLQSGVFYAIAPVLAEKHQVILVDQQGHGRTADIDRPFTFEQMADDTAELLEKIGVKQADFFGYSEGGVVAQILAIRHPKLVRRLALGSTVFRMDGYRPEVQSGMRRMTARMIPKQMRERYEAVAPRPQDWANLVEKSAELARTWQGIRREELQRIKAPALVLMADKDYLPEEHGHELARLLKGEFVVLPRSTHMSYLFKPKKLLGKLVPFLDVQLPE